MMPDNKMNILNEKDKSKLKIRELPRDGLTDEQLIELDDGEFF